MLIMVPKILLMDEPFSRSMRPDAALMENELLTCGRRIASRSCSLRTTSRRRFRCRPRGRAVSRTATRPHRGIRDRFAASPRRCRAHDAALRPLHRTSGAHERRSAERVCAKSRDAMTHGIGAQGSATGSRLAPRRQRTGAARSRLVDVLLLGGISHSGHR